MVTLRYPDGGHNAEAMFVTGGNLYIVSKEKTLDTGTVYRADVSPLRDGATRRMQKVTTVRIGNISAADVGVRGIVIRNYRHGLFYRWRADHRVATALDGASCDVEVGPGAESIAFTTWNRSMYSIPEGSCAAGVREPPPVGSPSPEPARSARCSVAAWTRTWCSPARGCARPSVTAWPWTA